MLPSSKGTAQDSPIRNFLLEIQRKYIAQAPVGIVVEGRDIGTVVAPHAQLKIYLHADIDARAKRREIEMLEDLATKDVEQSLSRRDEIDSTRAVSPLAQARDVMQLSFEYGGFLQEQADKLIKTTVTNSDVDDFLSKLFPVPADIAAAMGKRPLEKNELKVINMLDNKKDTIKNLYHNSPGQQMLDTNAWRLFNSVTEYADYYSNVRGSTANNIKIAKDARRAERVVLAEGEVIKDRALDLLLQ